MRNLVTRVCNWNIKRGLLKRGFDLKTETLHLLEELIELNYDIESNLARHLATELHIKLMHRGKELGLVASSERQKIDALADTSIFAIGGMAKLNYAPSIAFEETLLEIESRVGSIIEGKFVKDVSEKAVASWYTADYGKAKVTHLTSGELKNEI